MHPDEIRFWLLLWLLVGSVAVCGLLAVWAAFSARHWFTRTAVLIGGAWLLTIVPASDLVIVFAAETACIVIPLSAWRSWTSRGERAMPAGSESRLRFRLLDLLLITAVCAAVAAIAARLPAELLATWPFHVMWGVACGCTVTAACCALLGGRAPILTAITPLVAAYFSSQTPDPLAVIMLAHPPCLYDWQWPEWAWYPALALIAAVIVLWLFLFRATSRRLRCQNPTRRALPGGVLRGALAGFSVMLVAPCLLAYWQMLTPTPVPAVSLPTPNGYDELKRIGRALEEDVPQDVEAATEAELRKFVAKHRQELRDAQTALARECVVPLKYTPDDIADPAMRSVYRGLWVRARLAEFEGRCDDACDDYLLILQVADKSARGGLLIDWLIGSAVRGGGLAGLERLRAGLSYAQLQKAFADVTAHQARFEPVQEVVLRDRVWLEYAYGWPHRIHFLREPPEPVYAAIDTYNQAELRLVQCDLAIRLYEHDHGAWPDSLDRLAPDYLKAVPLDPYTNRPPIYRVQPHGFLLYSTGSDKTDNGGIRTTPTRTTTDGEDLTLAPPISHGPCAILK